jgi:hypothetical protein
MMGMDGPGGGQVFVRDCHAQDSDLRHGSQGITEPPQALTCVQVRAERTTGVDERQGKIDGRARRGVMGMLSRF